MRRNSWGKKSGAKIQKQGNASVLHLPGPSPIKCLHCAHFSIFNLLFIPHGLSQKKQYNFVL